MQKQYNWVDTIYLKTNTSGNTRNIGFVSNKIIALWIKKWKLQISFLVFVKRKYLAKSSSRKDLYIFFKKGVVVPPYTVGTVLYRWEGGAEKKKPCTRRRTWRENQGRLDENVTRRFQRSVWRSKHKNEVDISTALFRSSSGCLRWWKL